MNFFDDFRDFLAEHPQAISNIEVKMQRSQGGVAFATVDLPDEDLTPVEIQKALAMMISHNVPATARIRMSHSHDGARITATWQTGDARHQA